MASAGGIGELSGDVQLGAGVLAGLALVQFGSSFIDQLVNGLTSRGGLSQFTSIGNLLVDGLGIYFSFAYAGKRGSAFTHGMAIGLGSGFTLRAARDIGALVGFSIPRVGVTF